MSIRLMSAIFETEFRDMQDSEGNNTKASTAKFVCLAYADHANDEGEGAYPSFDTIAKKTGLSRTCVINTVDALRHNGILSYVGLSKWDTNNFTVNPECFIKVDGSKLRILVNPVDSHQLTQLTPLVNPVDPNHPLTVHKSLGESKKTDETKADYIVQANRKVDAILDFERQAQEAKAQGKGWRGRELLPLDYILYGDLWHRLTGLEMYGAKAKPKMDTEWLKAFKECFEHEVSESSFCEAYVRETWDGRRAVGKPSMIVATAKAIQAAGRVVESTNQREQGKGFYA